MYAVLEASAFALAVRLHLTRLNNENVLTKSKRKNKNSIILMKQNVLNKLMEGSSNEKIEENSVDNNFAVD